MARIRVKKRTDLTPKQAIFTEQYARTLDPIYAATRAGYSTPKTEGFHVLKQANVQAALAAKLESGAIAAMAMPHATRKLIKRLDDEKTSNRDYSTLFTQLRNTAESFMAGSDHEKAIQDMTPEEVAEAIKRLEDRASSEARDVTPGPSSAFD